jgi:hypothetical protein
MGKISVASVLFFIVSGLLLSSDSRGENQQPPVVTLVEKLRIDDQEGNFYFKYPQAPVIDSRGFIFVMDRDQVLMFSPSGSLIRNFFKEGLGPGEMTDACGVVAQEDLIVICNRNPHKLLWFDRSGTLQKEQPISARLGYADLLTYYRQRFYFLREQFRKTKGKAVFLDIKVRLLSSGPNDREPRFENIWFPKKYFVRDTNWIKNVHFVQIGTAGDDTVYIAHNGNYDIKRLSLENMRLSPFIQKDYQKVKIKEEWKKILKPFRFPHQGIKGKEYRTFEYEVLDDVQRIFVNGDKIWIITSTFDDHSRLVGVDVYDPAGKPRGRLRLQMSAGIYLFKMSYTPMTFHSTGLYVFETNEEGDLELARYLLNNVPPWAK